MCRRPVRYVPRPILTPLRRRCLRLRPALAVLLLASAGAEAQLRPAAGLSPSGSPPARPAQAERPPAAPSPAQAAPPAPEAAGPAVERVRAALALRERGDLAGAIAALEPARREPDPPAVVIDALGALYLEAGRAADALAVLAPRTEGPGADPVVLFNAARAALALDRPGDAERWLRASVAEAPVSRAALLLWELLDAGERHREAAEALRPLAEGTAAAAVERDDPDLAAEIALRFGRSLAAAGDPAAAAAPLERYVRLRPDDESGWRRLGEALLEAERYDEAREALARAQELAERDRAADLERRAEEAAGEGGFDRWMGEAAERRAAGDLQGSLAALREAVRSAPRDPRPRMLEIRLLVTLGRTAEALPRTEELAALTGESPEALYLRGMTRLAAGDPAGAEADLSRVVEARPEHVAALNGLAAALVSRGELAEAERLSRRVLELAPADPVAARTLRRIEERRNAG